MEKRYQVFISSTFLDLKEERSAVYQTVMEMDCFPAGMELFPAIDDEQFNFIKSIIDDSDYYILIIGGRYGTIAPEGISYTEKEYDYAIEKGLRVIAFIHGDPDSISSGKTDKDPEALQKLEDFKARVSADRLVKSWTSIGELQGLVATSLNKTIKTYPAVGWARANTTGNTDLLKELNELRKSNDSLEEEIESLEYQIHELESEDYDEIIFPKELAEFDSEHKFEVGYRSLQSKYERVSINATWEYLFGVICPKLTSKLTENSASIILADNLLIANNIDYLDNYSPHIDRESLELIRIQLQAYGLIKIKPSSSIAWEITELGQIVMLDLKTVKRSLPNKQ